MNVLSFNLGSSSLKYAVHSMLEDTESEILAASIDADPDPSAAAPAAQRAIAHIAELGISIDAVGHRVVFGGEYERPSAISPALIARLAQFAQLDPLHAPGSLAIIRQACAALEDAVHVACFDTAFFHDLPPEARALPIPVDGDPLLRRYGFHGLSYENAVRELGAELAPCTIVAHLGSGCSAAALLGGRPVETTMGFSTLGGILMASRPGDLDAGVLLYLLEQNRYDCRSLRAMLENSSGLRALSGGEGDVRRLCDRTDERAVFALEMFVRSVAEAVAALAVTLGRLDMLVFTGGIGEHNARVRDAICARLRFITGRIDVRVVTARENLTIARHAARVAAGLGGRGLMEAL